jgi:hypothetical protein
VPKKQNIGFNRATADASREGDKETPGNARRQFPEEKANAIHGDLAPKRRECPIVTRSDDKK